MVRNSPVPLVIEPLRNPTKKSPAMPPARAAPCRFLGWCAMPRLGLNTEYRPRPRVSTPSARVAARSGTCRIVSAPSTTPGSPAPRMISEKRRSRCDSFRCRRVAPSPSATLAILCVASATPKGSPRKMRTGNWIRPAPPPDSAEKKFAAREATNKTSWSNAFIGPCPRFQPAAWRKPASTPRRRCASAAGRPLPSRRRTPPPPATRPPVRKIPHRAGHGDRIRPAHRMPIRRRCRVPARYRAAIHRSVFHDDGWLRTQTPASRLCSFEKPHRIKPQSGRQKGPAHVNEGNEAAGEPQAAHQRGDDFGGKRRERGQPAEQTGDQKKPRFRRQARMLDKPGNGKADAVAAAQIGRQRAQRHRGKQGIEPQPQPPALFGSVGCAQADGEKGDHGRDGWMGQVMPPF